MLGYVYEEWRESAVCKSSDPELWFPEHGGDGGRKAKNICRTCPVIASCAKATLRGDEQHGVWAGINVGSDRHADQKLQRLAAGDPALAVLGEAPPVGRRKKPPVKPAENPKPSPRQNVRHGTISGYKHYRCRCAKCREAHTEYRRADYRRRMDRKNAS